MPGDTFQGGTATEVPVSQMSKGQLVTAIREFEQQHIPDKELQQLDAFWARLGTVLGIDVSPQGDTS